MKIQPVILCGGSGTRLWPASRTKYPKQFMRLGNGSSLFKETLLRTDSLRDTEEPIVVSNDAYRFYASTAMHEEGKAGAIILEPRSRNTAPAIALAAFAALEEHDSLLLVLPSDHRFAQPERFCAAVEQARPAAEAGMLVTFGIKPTSPETGYGYIQVGKPVGHDIFHVKTFTEKPELELAKVFLESGEFFWNSGIFLWTAKTIIREIKNNAPDISSCFEKGLNLFGTPAEKQFIDENFPGCMGISIDFAVMEKATNVYVECVTFGWNDLGTWSALYDNSPKNRDANVTQNCNVLSYNSSDNIFAVNGEKLVVVSGLQGYIVADAGDVLLICPKSEEQKIKQMVNDAKLSFGEKYL